MRRLWMVLLITVLAACAQEDAAQAPTPQVLTLLDGEQAGYAIVQPGRTLTFPEDHAAHEDYRAEWWYYTGRLNAQNGAEYGFQVTLFRFNINPNMPPRTSRWATNQIYMGHVALTDIQRGQYDHSERIERGALGLAGAQREPFRVWLHDWVIEGDLLAPRIHATTEHAQLDLSLQALKPIVLQGDQGYLHTGRQAQNASYYYSIPRMSVRGEIRFNGEQAQQVTGQAWFDREWFSRALEKTQQGWDWFSLQLSDNQELMYYRIRDEQGRADVYSQGVLVNAAGEALRLSHEDVVLTPLTYWRSKKGLRYPIAWRLEAPRLQMVLEVHTQVPDQLFQGLVEYWEGAVEVSGSIAGRPVDGVGYLELTGY